MIVYDHAEVYRQDRKINWNRMRFPERDGLAIANLDHGPTTAIRDSDSEAVRQSPLCGTKMLPVVNVVLIDSLHTYTLERSRSGRRLRVQTFGR